MNTSSSLALHTEESARPGKDRGIVLTGFIAMFVALASALLPGSMPASQTVGSAFNPATTQVALGRKDAEEAAIRAVVNPRSDSIEAGGGMGAADHGILPVFWRTNVTVALLSPSPGRLAGDFNANEHRLPGAGPRAPPLLI